MDREIHLTIIVLKTRLHLTFLTSKPYPFSLNPNLVHLLTRFKLRHIPHWLTYHLNNEGYPQHPQVGQQ